MKSHEIPIHSPLMGYIMGNPMKNPIKPPFPYGFPMVFLWFSYGFPMVFLWFSSRLRISPGSGLSNIDTDAENWAGPRRSSEAPRST